MQNQYLGNQAEINKHMHTFLRTNFLCLKGYTYKANFYIFNKD